MNLSLPDGSVIVRSPQLPGMDGYAVARPMHSTPPLAAVPMIGVISYAMAGDREKAMAPSCNGYIEKPIDPDTFVAEVEAIMASFTRNGQ